VPDGFGVELPVCQLTPVLILILTVEFTGMQTVVDARAPEGMLSRVMKS
jgi:hypothetical protein